MRTISRIFVAPLLCCTLFVCDAFSGVAMARGERGGGARGGARQAAPARKAAKPAARQRQAVQRPTRQAVQRPTRQQASGRNPITGSKVQRPATRPQTRPATKPTVQRPAQRPANRPTTQPAQRPANRPAKLPDKRPATRPDNRPTTRPGQTRPNVPDKRPAARPVTRPGNVTYPKPGRPTTRPATRPGANRPGNNRPNFGDRNNVVVRPGQNTRPVQRPNFNTRPGNRPGGNNNWWSGGRNNIGNNVNININNNFRKSVNWSTNRRYWGYNPWWNRPAVRPWYGGTWNCGWNRRYYNHYHRYYWGGYRPLPGYVVIDHDHDVAEAIGWGLAAWSLGKLIFDSGYNRYSNPYPAQPVGNVTYSQPITVVAAEAEGSADDLERANDTSEGFIEKSQDAFKARDYLVALENANKAVEAAPGDGALHEYRALVLFALGKYGEAAGVLNPVLASGPGWDWSTMVTLYDAQQTYTDQLRKLEDYAGARSDDAAAHFLLGYHYMVCGHLDLATAEFDTAAKLQPADGVSKQLADLCRASTDSAVEPAGEEAPPETEAPPEPPPVEELAGTWVADKGEAGTITLSLKDDGKFTWGYTQGGKTSDFGGNYSMNDNGLLVLDTDDTQMVATVDMPSESELKFVLAGGPPGDPGLDFKKH